MKNKENILIILTVLPILVLIILWNSLPEQIPIHWNFSGEIDGYGSRYLVILIIVPAYFLTRLATSSIPGKFKERWGRVRLFIMLFLAVISVSIIVAGFGYPVPMVPMAAGGIVALSALSLV